MNGIDSSGMHELKLAALLSDLIGRFHHKGAALELGVGYNTLLRYRQSGKVTKTLRMALEQYLLKGPHSSSAPWWKRIEGLETRLRTVEVDYVRISNLEKEQHQMAPQLHRLQNDVTDVRERMSRVEDGLKDHGNLVSGMAPATEATNSSSRRIGSCYHADPFSNGTQSVSEPPDDGDYSEREKAILAWHGAVADKRRARTRLEQDKAAERLLELELVLIEDYRESVPPGESWHDARMEKEAAWRWLALENARKRLRRTKLLVWIRFVTTVGLWWP